jgi:hypothetical protein
MGGSNDPFRGEFVHDIDTLILLLVIPVASCVLVLATQQVKPLVQCIEALIPEDHDNDFKNESRNNLYPWSEAIYSRYITKLGIDEELYLQEWVTIRGIGELSEPVGKQLFYPLFVLAIMMLARAGFFDNWVMLPGLKIVFGVIFCYLIYLDFCLKTAIQKADRQILKVLHQKSISIYKHDQEKEIAQFEKMVGWVEQYAYGVYKPFFKRPIFQGVALLVTAIVVGYIDDTVLMMKLFK